MFQYSLTVMIGLGLHQTSPTRRNQPTFVNRMNFAILTIKEIEKIIKKAACMMFIRTGVVFEVNVM